MKCDYPTGTAHVIQIEKLIRNREQPLSGQRMSARMVQCASVLDPSEFLGWQMYVPRKGLARLSLFSSQALTFEDLKWAAEKVARPAPSHRSGRAGEEGTELYEFCLPTGTGPHGRGIGFGADRTESGADMVKWPVRCSAQFEGLLQALRITGAYFRAVLGNTAEEERARCEAGLLHSWESREIDWREYLGRPVKAKFLLRLPGAPSVRLQTVLAASGTVLRRLGSMDEAACQTLWDAPLTEGMVLPECAARTLLFEPIVFLPVIGIESCEEPVPDLPASHKGPAVRRKISLGRAMDTAGRQREIYLGEPDLKRHYQIVGQTGTGKSTLLASVIVSAARQGLGLTFFDPHGSTIDTILKSIPGELAGRVRVVRIGDAENPVPLNIWDSGDVQGEERNISDLCELFSDIFDPRREGFVGPRYERWLSTFAKASIALLGRQASLESIAVLSRDQNTMRKLCKAIERDYPEIARTIEAEYSADKSADFQNTLNWYLCKFQRLTSVEQMRKTLGAGANALDFRNTIDTDAVTLIDLASPVIGTHAARIIGSMLLMKLWNAAMTRKDRDRTHLVLVDEAALFQTNPLPRMLAESRKFGLSMVLCHQHTSQLTEEIRDPLEANSANFSSFRLSPRDAAIAAIRFDDPTLQIGLARLDAFKAITTLSVDGKQTAPFTLRIRKVKQQRDGQEIAERIQRRSIETLVEPYRCVQALTPSEILERLENAGNTPPPLEIDLLEEEELYREEPWETARDFEEDQIWPDWLRQWEEYADKQGEEGLRNGGTDAVHAQKACYAGH